MVRHHRQRLRIWAAVAMLLLELSLTASGDLAFSYTQSCTSLDCSSGCDSVPSVSQTFTFSLSAYPSTPGECVSTSGNQHLFVVPGAFGISFGACSSRACLVLIAVIAGLRGALHAASSSCGNCQSTTQVMFSCGFPTWSQCIVSA